jgi:sialic acid synthase SpsE
VIALRPGTGIPARQIDEVVGRRAARDIPADTMLEPADLA